jgi:hypothetical protein
MPPDDLDLSAELDAAEDIVTGRAKSVVTEWGVRRKRCNGFGYLRRFSVTEAGPLCIDGREYHRRQQARKKRQR